ncbi:MAG: trimethylamine methyltransferase family protein, partial [Actinomycetota bacterium]
MTDTERHRKSGGRAARQATRRTSGAQREAYLTRLIKPYELASEEVLSMLEHNADTILEEIGVEIRDYPSAIERFKAAGASVDGTRVRFARGMCRSIIQASAPREYVQHARNPLNNVRIGGDATVFAPNYGSPFVHDLDNGRRYATIGDFQNFVKLSYMSPYIH